MNGTSEFRSENKFIMKTSYECHDEKWKTLYPQPRLARLCRQCWTEKLYKFRSNVDKLNGTTILQNLMSNTWILCNPGNPGNPWLWLRQWPRTQNCDVRAVSHSCDVFSPELKQRGRPVGPPCTFQTQPAPPAYFLLKWKWIGQNSRELDLVDS